MLESLIQFLNDHMKSLQTFFRRFVDYSQVIGSACQLDAATAEKVKDILAEMGHSLACEQSCLVIKNKSMTSLLLLNGKNRLEKQVNVPEIYNELFYSLDEHSIYHFVG